MRNLKFKLGGIGNIGFPPAVFGNGADGLEGLDVERRVGRWRNGENAFPEIVELEEELDFFGAQNIAGDHHGGFALGTRERIFAPDAHNEIAPEWAEFAIRSLGPGDGRWDGLSGSRRIALGMRALAGDRYLVAPLFEASGFVGVDTVVSDSVMVAVGDMFDGSREKISGGEDLEIALGFPVVARAVDGTQAGARRP